MSTLSVTNLTTGSGTTSLGITTGNTSATGMFLSSNGNVGIGTTTLNYSGYGTSNLTVKGGTTLQGVLELVGNRGDTAGNAVGDINFFAESNTLGNKRVAFIQSTLSGNQTGNKGGALAFFTKLDGSSTTLAAMVIDNAGNVGIGGTTDINGKITSYQSATQVAFSSYGAGSVGYPAFGFNGQNFANGGRGTGLYSPADGVLGFVTSALERMRIDVSGKVILQAAGQGIQFADGTTQTTAGSGGFSNIQLFVANNTFTVPSGITKVKVTVVGGGGGGGGVNSTYAGSSGGGGGGTAIKIISGLTPGATVAVTVGDAGIAAVGAGRGGNGGQSAFGSYCSASGGTGGYAQSSACGIGGIGTNGDLNIGGSAGTGGSNDNTGAGGITNGIGGSSFMGGAGYGNGRLYGGGGSVGYLGAAGVVVVEY
jgi:hypothetical protein